MNNTQRSRIVTLKQGQTVYLGNIPLLSLTEANQPLLKMTVDLIPTDGKDKAFLYDHNEENWVEVGPRCLVVGLGDKIIVSKVQILITAYSKRYGEVRFSLRSDEPKIAALLSTCTWR